MDFPNSWKFLKVREAESSIMLRSQRRCRLPPHPPPPPTTPPPRVLHSTQACPSHVLDGKARGCRMKTSHGCSHSHAIFHPKQPPHSGMLPPSQTQGVVLLFSSEVFPLRPRHGPAQPVLTPHPEQLQPSLAWLHGWEDGLTGVATW